MYQSKFLLNRQKIYNPPEINTAIASHFEHLPAPQRGRFFYRLEWYKIGVVVQMLVYSEVRPMMKMMPECQLIETGELDNLPLIAETLDFAIFLAPPAGIMPGDEIDEAAIITWLQKQLGKTATIINYGFGPNNCIYYNEGGEDRQQQTVTIKGILKVLNRDALDRLRQKPIGRAIELGCGLLYLTP